MSRVILPPPERGCGHNLPDADEYPHSSVAACGRCRKWFQVVERYDGFGGYWHWWARVYWFHVVLRHRIREYKRKNRGLLNQYVPDDFKPGDMSL